MAIGSFADTGTVETETIELSRALLEIEEITLNYGDDPDNPSPYTVKNKDSEVLFNADPNINAKIWIVDDYGDGTYDDKRFFDKFYLKLNKDTGLWEIGENSKLGYLIKAHPKYGPDHFKNPKPVEENDLKGFRFEAGTEQREDRSGKKLEGTRLAWKSIGPVPDRSKKKKHTQQVAVEDREIDEAEMEAALGQS